MAYVGFKSFIHIFRHLFQAFAGEFLLCVEPLEKNAKTRSLLKNIMPEHRVAFQIFEPASESRTPPLLKLPPELRNQTYECVATEAPNTFTVLEGVPIPPSLA